MPLSDVAGQVGYPAAAVLAAAGTIGAVTGFRRLLKLGRDIRREVLPNGGSSLRDAVERMEVALLAVTEQGHETAAKLDSHLRDSRREQRKLNKFYESQAA